MEVLNLIIFSLLIFSSSGQKILDGPCDGGWDEYNDEKCVKVFELTDPYSHEEADKFCRDKYDGNLVSIPDEAKQTFIENYLKNQNIPNADYIWIGLSYSDNQYVWVDGSDFTYTNWAPSNPNNDPTLCAELETDDANFGRWNEKLCDNGNKITLCEKVQLWSSSYLQNEILHLRSKAKNLETDVTHLKATSVPIGFIYVQLSGQDEPTEIWPDLSWQDVSSQYDSLFFRVVGDNAASFDSIQEENAPRLIRVHRVETSDASYDIRVYADGSESTPIDADDSSDADRALRFTVSGGEVRPRNQAVKIWKRTG